MNMLTDTNERKASPSVWPVYVAVVVLLAMGTFLILAFTEGLVNVRHWEPDSLLWGVLGLAGLIAACGLVGLRQWAWWCAVVVTAVWTILGGVYLLDMFFSVDDIWVAAHWLLTGVLIAVPLATRRQLFFPPKQAGEE